MLVQFCFVIVPIFIILALLLWLVNKSMDEDRVRGWLETRGNKLLECKHTPTTRGWLEEAKERLYEVRYLDTDGHEHFATCKTGMFTGITWTEDKFLRYADQVQGVPMPGHTEVRKTSAEEEKRRAQEMLEQAKRQQKPG